MRQNSPLATLFRLDGRVALITGAGGAFGRAIALGFADVGARLFLTDLDPKTLEETCSLVRGSGGECASWPADAGASADVEAVFQHLDGDFGHLDILVNNAGRNPMQGQPEAFPLEIWEEVLRTNLTGYFLFA